MHVTDQEMTLCSPDVRSLEPQEAHGDSPQPEGWIAIKTAAADQLRAAVTLADPRWQAVMARDTQADGTFFYAVLSTGVYCRPSCASRAAHPANVSFYPTAAAAEQAGFRACKRCAPKGLSLRVNQAERVERVCRAIETAETPYNLQELAAIAELSPTHLHRLFRSTMGVTPRQYSKAHRNRVLRRMLPGASTVTEALYDAGYNSSGRFYEATDTALGMTPTAFRAGGKGEQIRFALGQTSLGAILVAQSGRGVCAILLGDDPDSLLRELEETFPCAQLTGADPEFDSLVAQVVGLVEDPALGIELALDIRGTAFQQRVWQALRALPVGARVTYTEIAEAIGQPSAVRAVAGACAANVLAIAIPCHRVVRRGGDVSGYRWGVERKRTLLERESAQDRLL